MITKKEKNRKKKKREKHKMLWILSYPPVISLLAVINTNSFMKLLHISIALF